MQKRPVVLGKQPGVRPSILELHWRVSLRENLIQLFVAKGSALPFDFNTVYEVKKNIQVMKRKYV